MANPHEKEPEEEMAPEDIEKLVIRGYATRGRSVTQDYRMTPDERSELIDLLAELLDNGCIRIGREDRFARALERLVDVP